MDGTLRVRSAAGVATAVVLAVLCTLLATQAWSAGAAPGDSDSTFVPTAGCRLADTRAAPNTVGSRATPLGAGDVFEVTVHGANGDCTGALAIPADAVGVALNVTAVNATAQSNIRIYPANLAEVPTLSNLNVTAGAPPTPNKVDVKLSPDGKIRVYNFRGSVNIFIDVVGYYTDATLQELSQRVVALEAAQSAGIDPAVLARITSLEAATDTNSSAIDALGATIPRTLGIGSHYVFQEDQTTFGDFEFTTGPSGASHTITFFDARPGCPATVRQPVLLTSAGGPNVVGIEGWGCADGDLTILLSSESGGSPSDIDFGWVVYDGAL